METLTILWLAGVKLASIWWPVVFVLIGFPVWETRQLKKR